jgi:hypothetical protein
MKRLGSFLLIVAIALMLGGNALAQNNGRETAKCSNATLKGDYGFTVNGTIFPVPAAFGVPNNTIYIQGVQMMHFDGKTDAEGIGPSGPKGNLTDNEALILNGVPLVPTAGPSFFSVHTGTYTVNSDCTGLAYLSNVPEGGVNFIWLSFVVDKRGKQIRMVGVPPFDSGGIPRTVTSVGDKVD